MKHPNDKPPKLAQRILIHLFSRTERDNILGDFEEFYTEIYKETNAFKENKAF